MWLDFPKNQVIGNVSMIRSLKKVKRVESSGGGEAAGCRRRWAGKETLTLKKRASLSSIRIKRLSACSERVFTKSALHRAARIMDQLAEAGVVGEEAPSPGRVLDRPEQFEQYPEES